MTGIAEWLKTVGLDKYESLFAEHEITLDVLPHLTPTDIDQLGLPVGPRRRLLVEIQALAAAPQTTTPTPAPAASSGAERRQLTVMFCDLVGSTALAERLDPEELRELMQTYRKACSDVAHRYEGHVAQYLGDGLMIYFGWPRAHEDDGERGVRAALEMVEAVRRLPTKESLAVRIGLATGPVVVGDETSERHTEARLAVGETPNLAARLQGLAGSNEVVIAAATRRLVGNAFLLKDLGLQTVKGLADPVGAWRVDALHREAGRFEAAHGASTLTPLVGREEEMLLLLRRWQSASDGQGQVVVVSGEAGIGKSRLTRVLRDRTTGPQVMFRYQCSPFHVHSALYPFLEQFEFLAGMSRDDSPDDRLDKLEAALAGTAEQKAEFAPLLAAALSLPTTRYPALKVSPQKQKEQTLDALVAQIEARAAQGTVLMLFEDLHWVDATSQELLDRLVHRLHDLPVMLVGTCRPEHTSPWIGQPHVTTINLSRLGRPQVAELVGRVTGGKPMPPEVLAEILARTDGVPLFVEELTKSVLESGLLREDADRYTLQAPLGTLVIPTSLRDSLAARLDRLTTVKEIAQIGACIGREFSFELIAGVSTLGREDLEAALERLVDAGLVNRRGAPPDANYIFKHALVQDVAYDSLLKSRRSQLHARIAGALEADFGDLVAHEPALLAHHHTHAGNLETAIPLWRQAGERAVSRVAMVEAVAHFQKGLGLIDQMPQSHARDALELTIREQLNAAWAGLHGWAAAEIDANSEAILRLARSQGASLSLLMGIWWMWTNTITQGRIADSLPWAKQLLAEAEEADDLDLRIFGHATAAIPYFFLGRLDDAEYHADRVRALYDPQRAERWIQLTGHDLQSFVDVYRCQWTWMLGYPDRALAIGARAVTQAEAVGHAFNLVWARTFTAYAFAYRREPDRLLERLTEVDRMARDQGLNFLYEVSAPQAEGLARLQQGRVAEAVPIIRKGIESWTRAGGHVRTPFLKANLAEALALQGDADGALNLLDECVDQIERSGWLERVWLPEVLRLRGWIFMREARHEEAERLLRQAMTCAAEQHARSWELRSAITLADLLTAQGRTQEARDMLTPIFDWFTEGFDSPDLVAARTRLDALRI